MGSCDRFIQKVKALLPELCTSKDLVKCGLYRSEQSVRSARMRGCSPEFFKLPSGQIIYPKDGVIELLEKSKNPGVGA